MIEFWGSKWGAKNLAAKDALLQCIRSAEGVSIELAAEELSVAFRSVRATGRLDAQGLSMTALLLLWEAHPDAVRRAIDACLADCSSASALGIDARIFGKCSARVRPSETRCIQPLGVLGQLADFCLAARLQSHCSKMCPQPRGCLHGAVRGTQPLDISFAVARRMETARTLSQRLHDLLDADIPDRRTGPVWKLTALVLNRALS